MNILFQRYYFNPPSLNNLSRYLKIKATNKKSNEEFTIEGPYGLITICQPERLATKFEIQQLYKLILEIIINKVISDEKIPI